LLFLWLVCPHDDGERPAAAAVVTTMVAATEHCISLFTHQLDQHEAWRNQFTDRGTPNSRTEYRATSSGIAQGCIRACGGTDTRQASRSFGCWRISDRIALT